MELMESTQLQQLKIHQGNTFSKIGAYRDWSLQVSNRSLLIQL